MSENTRKIQQVPIDDILEYPSNARTHPESQIAKIAASIKEFGFVNPIIVDRDNMIIAGHGRLYAAKKIGMKTVPVLQERELTGARKRAYILADNRLAELATWDQGLFNRELDAINNAGVDLGLAGIFDFEIDRILDGNEPGQSTQEEEEVSGNTVCLC